MSIKQYFYLSAELSKFRVLLMVCLLLFSQAVVLQHTHTDPYEHQDCQLCLKSQADDDGLTVNTILIQVRHASGFAAAHELFIPSLAPNDTRSRAPPLA